MNIYCTHHLGNHRKKCYKICRFCRIPEKENTNNNNIKSNLQKCLTCTGYYCSKCYEKHNIHTDKYKVKHNDK